MATPYGQGKGRQAQQELEEGRKVLQSLGSRYKDLEGALELDADLGAAATRFDAAPSASEDGLYLAKKAKEEAPSPIELAAAAKPPRPTPGAGGTGAPLTAEVAAWQQKVRAHVRRNWALTPGLRGKGLKTLMSVELTASGLIVDFDIERSSGNPWFDESVERFLEETGCRWLSKPFRLGDLLRSARDTLS